VSAMTDEEFEEFLNTPVRMRFWACPVVEHRDRRDEQGRPTTTVEWDEHGIAHCLTPGCDNTSAPKTEEPA
jgi:hypothetical protein